MSVSEAQYRDMLARTLRSQVREPPTASDEPESELHDQIIDECRRLGWYCRHCRMDKKTTDAVGTPDFIIAIPGGITLWIECKRKGSKPTMPQLAASAHLRHLGHLHGFCYSFEEFQAFVGRLKASE